MAEFHVVIEGLKLTAAEDQALNDAIQKVVLEHLADHDITKGSKPGGLVAFRPHPDWRGLVAKVVTQRELSALPSFEKSQLRPGG
jgi:hypothetical protein